MNEADQARLVAERIARKVTPAFSAAQGAVDASSISAELEAVRASLSELQNRLVNIESQVRSSSISTNDPGKTPPALRAHSPWLAGINADLSHPSQERFGIEEATISELVDFFQKEKTCSVEPGGKPCDHCSMCSSRGF